MAAQIFQKLIKLFVLPISSTLTFAIYYVICCPLNKLHRMSNKAQTLSTCAKITFYNSCAFILSKGNFCLTKIRGKKNPIATIVILLACWKFHTHVHFIWHKWFSLRLLFFHLISFTYNENEFLYVSLKISYCFSETIPETKFMRISLIILNSPLSKLSQPHSSDSLYQLNTAQPIHK